LITNYVHNHREKLKILYQTISEKSSQNKEKYIGKINKNSEKIDLPTQNPTTVFVKNKQKQNKLKNKYKPENLIKTNLKLNTGEIQPQHYNTRKKIHLSNVKRPRKITYKFEVNPVVETSNEPKASTSKT